MPNSSGVTLICRRSVALMVPSWIGTSYCLPVRLSVIVSVSGIGRHVRRDLVGRRLPGHVVAPRQPPSQVRPLAPLAAEWPPRRVHRFIPAVDAPRVEGGQNPLIVYRPFALDGQQHHRQSALPLPVAAGMGEVEDVRFPELAAGQIGRETERDE